MRHRLGFSSLPLVPLFLALALAMVPTARAGTIWYVDGVNGNDSNDCKSATTACKTIGHAISLASSGDTIGVGPATYTENLTIGVSLKVIGSGAATTIVDGGGVNTVVTIPNSGTHVTLSRVTIRNGHAVVGVGGGGILNYGTLTINSSVISANTTSVCGALCSGGGGGIYSVGTLTINNSTIRRNTITTPACYRFCMGGGGGGIYNAGTLTVNSSTISGNFASNFDSNHVYGGGIWNGGTFALNNSTVSGNIAISHSDLAGAASGGGIAVFWGTVTINNSTLSGNSAISLHASSFGGGISGKATLQNSIVAKNTSLIGGNCNGTMTSNGYNLSSDGTCNFNNAGDLNNTDPKLGPLQNNGGPTQTQALLAGSPAIDAGNPAGCTDGQGHLLKTDQRGQPRPDKEDTGGCDMGAFERQTD